MGRFVRRLLTNPGEVVSAAIALLRAPVVLRRCARGKSIYVFHPVVVRGSGRVSIGDRVTFIDGVMPTVLRTGPEGSIEIGDDTLFNYGVSIEADQSVRLGRRVLLASYVRLGDRGRSGAAPITIGDDVWLAHGVIVEPGVTIGDGSVVSAGSVVTRDVPPHSIAAGNPARAVPLDLASTEPAARRA